jgi:hypothetical protein
VRTEQVPQAAVASLAEEEEVDLADGGRGHGSRT